MPKVNSLLKVALLSLLLLANSSVLADDDDDDDDDDNHNSHNAGCEIIGADDLVFPNYDPLSSEEVTGMTAISIRCAGSSGDDDDNDDGHYTHDVHLKLDHGHHMGSNNSYKMTDNHGHFLNYNLHLDHPNYVSRLSGSHHAGHSGFGPHEETSQYNIHGKIPPGQNGAAPGNYADTVLVTVEFSSNWHDDDDNDDDDDHHRHSHDHHTNGHGHGHQTHTSSNGGHQHPSSTPTHTGGTPDIHHASNSHHKKKAHIEHD